MTNVHGLNNLLWVWNGQDPEWYPGDETIDFIGMDIYEGKGNHSSHIDAFARAQSFIQGDELKMIAITENSSIPNPEFLRSEGVPWSWFMTWNDGNMGNPESDFFSGNLYTSDRNKKIFFSDPYMMKLSDLPKIY